MAYLESSIDSKHFEDQLKIFSSGLGGIFKELLTKVGSQMVAESKSQAPSKTGKLKNAIKFIFDDKNNIGALTTRKSLKKSNIWYARMVESGANIKAKKGKYLTFKIGGKWVKVESVQTRPKPFMKSVFNDYWEGTNAKGYQELAKALEDKMSEYLN